MENIFQLDLSEIKFVFDFPLLQWLSNQKIYEQSGVWLEELRSFFADNWQLFLFYLPIGIIGIWRWGVWLFKEIIGIFYRPRADVVHSSVSIITPVYNEDPQVFSSALASWVINNPNEIIAVIDHTDQRCIEIFKEFSKKYPIARLIITHTPGKREALADGIRTAKSEIVALVDSDTLWAKDVLVNSLSPFADRKIAGVATRQNVLEPKTLAQKIFDTQLDLRYFDEFPFLAAAGDALVCLSGRTAFYRREVILPMLDDLVNETFFGQKVISGDDKRLTYLVLAAGWKVAYQNNARVFTPGVESLKSYMKQRLRWTRNALRADSRAIMEGWVFRHPALLFFQLDKIIQGFTLLLSPMFFFVSLWFQLWLPALTIAIWWLASRSIKIWPHLRRRPQDIVVLPAFIIYQFVTAGMKIYALLTLNTQGWITRWDTSRLPRFNFLNKIPAYAGTLGIVIGLVAIVYLYKQQLTIQQALAVQFDHSPQNIVSDASLVQSSIPNNTLPNTFDNNGRMMITRYEIQPGDSLGRVAANHGITLNELLAANIRILPNWNNLEPGYVISIPRPGFSVNLQEKYTYTQKKPEALDVVYDEQSNTINVDGRGKRVSLKDIQAQLRNDRLVEIEPKVWILKSNLQLNNGVMLGLDSNEVEWLRLESNDNDGFLQIKVSSSVLTIDGVTITSWDSNKNDFDRNYGNGRSFILAKDFSRMDIYDAELAYLGYPRTRPEEESVYGVSWRMSRGKAAENILTGEVLNSKFHDNYFGAYSFGAVSIIWRGNEFYNNVQYGLDPHDDSNGFLVENNKFYNNGNHGLIFSKRCIDNTIRNNVSYDNKLHGIMLHEQSNNNLVENNIVYGNNDGIAIYHSSGNLINDNKVYNNDTGVRIYNDSVNNVVTDNLISQNSKYGIYLYDDANSNLILDNRLFNSPTAFNVKSKDNELSGNIIDGNRIGVYLTEGASGNKIINNQINNASYAVYSKINQGLINYINGNSLFNSNNSYYSI